MNYTMRPMLERIPSAYLAIYVTAADAFVWLGGLPYVLYCRALLTMDRANAGVLLAVLASNAAAIVLMFYALIATNEMVRRGIRRRTPQH